MWECSLKGQTKLICQSFGTANRTGLLQIYERYSVQPSLFEETCKECTDWHNSEHGIAELKYYKKRKEIIELKKNAYLGVINNY